MKKLKSIYFAFLLCLLLCCCATTSSSSSTDQQPIQESKKIPNYQMSLAFNGEAMIKRFEDMAEVISRRSDGDIRIVVFPKDDLGADPDLLKAMQTGSISMVAASSAIYTEMVPQMAIFDIPACFDDYIIPFVSYESDFLNVLNEYFRAQGLELLSVEVWDFRMLSTSKPVRNVDDLNNLSIRILGDDYHEKVWRQLGAEPVTGIKFRDLYSALEAGVIDAQENSPNVYLSAHLEEITPYLLNGPFYVAGNVLAINKQTFDSLPKSYQSLLKEEARRSSKISVLGMKNGYVLPPKVKYSEFNDEQKRILQQKLQIVLDEIQQNIGKDLISELKRANLNAKDE